MRLTNYKRTRSYIPKAEQDRIKACRAAGEDPGPVAVFYYKAPTARIKDRIACRFVRHESIISGLPSEETARAEAIRNLPEEVLADIIGANREYARWCVTGWDGLTDETGAPFPCEIGKDGKLTDDAFDALGDLSGEIGAAIAADETITVEDLKN